MKKTLSLLALMTVLLTACATNPHTLSTNQQNNFDDFDQPKPRGILAALNPAQNVAANSTNAFDNNATKTTWTKPDTSNMHLVQNEHNLTTSSATQIASGPGFSSVTKTATASGFSHQVWKGASHSAHFSAF